MVSFNHQRKGDFKMRNQINNYKSYADQYKYIVARRIDGELWFWGAWNDRNKANEVAIEIGGEVVTNE